MSKAQQRLRVLSPALCLSSVLTVGWAGCGDDSMNMMMMMMPPPPVKENPFTPLPECSGTAIDFRKGQKSLVIASIEIAAQNQGFDLDKDGKTDNKLGAVSSLANSELESVFTERHDIVIPIEFFGPTAGDASCTKFALYLGQFNQDRDKDTTDTNWESDSNAAKGDCNDQDKSVHPGAAEDVNFPFAAYDWAPPAGGRGLQFATPAFDHDVLLAGTQKAFALPPGLAVFTCSPAALAKAGDNAEFSTSADFKITASANNADCS